MANNAVAFDSEGNLVRCSLCDAVDRQFLWMGQGRRYRFTNSGIPHSQCTELRAEPFAIFDSYVGEYFVVFEVPVLYFLSRFGIGVGESRVRDFKGEK